MQQKKYQNLDNLRHSCAHLLAAAVLTLWPKTKNAIGPAIENGFYYDFDFGRVKISEEDLSKIEMEMKRIVKAWDKIERLNESIHQIKKGYKNNPYKLELIEEFERERKKVTLYKSGRFVDLCRGGHVKNPSIEIKHFKLLSVAGAYWRGSEKNKMLTRIYGTCFPNKKNLDEYLKLLEEAKKRDHRRIGKDLNLFVFSDLVGKGLPLFTKKGSVIRRELERFIVDEEIKRGYQHVYSPDIAKVELYEKSGHYPYYKDSMYPIMNVEDERLILRPMTCPHHFMLYASRPRSYKELPMRIAELASQYRYEKSGELTGLIRIRLFCLADAHIICKKEQAESEIDGVLDLIDYISKILGLKLGKDYQYRLSKGDRKDEKKFYKDDKSWDFSEGVLRKALRNRKAPFVETDGQAAFYGPKIDIQMKNVASKEETAFTVQYDFVMPKRFGMRFIDSDGKEKEPIVIHRSSIGALERVIAFLIEKYRGAFPVWLSPVQVKVLPITERNLDFAQKIEKELVNEGIRVELDSRKKTLQAKIRDAQLEKVPYMLIVGDKEEKAKKTRLRARSGKDHGSIGIDKFINNLKKEIEEKTLS